MDSFLIDILLKGTAILLLGIGVLFFLKKSLPTIRHFVGFGIMVSLLLLPLLLEILPAWRILPHGESVQEFTQIFYETKEVREEKEIKKDELGDEEAQQLSGVVVQYNKWADAVSQAREINWGYTFLGLWGIGFGLVLILVGVGVGNLWRLEKNSECIRCGDSFELLQQCAWRLGIKRKVALLLCGEKQMPMTWGVLAPRILLPQESLNWSKEKLRVVLLHELAHIKRWDCLTCFLGHLCCAVYWFHPLVWWMNSRMKNEAELACDDQVLSSGEKPSVYANHLLEVSREMISERVFSAPAIGMARPSKLGKRLVSILDLKRKRNQINPKMMLGIVVVLLGAVGGISASQSKEKKEAVESQLIPEVHVEENAWDPSGESNQLVVNIAPVTGIITLGENNAVPYEKPEQILPALLEEKKIKESLSGKPLRILIRADKDTKYGTIKEVLKVCQAAGVVDVFFAVHSEKAEPKKGSEKPQSSLRKLNEGQEYYRSLLLIQKMASRDKLKVELAGIEAKLEMMKKVNLKKNKTAIFSAFALEEKPNVKAVIFNKLEAEALVDKLKNQGIRDKHPRMLVAQAQLKKRVAQEAQLLEGILMTLELDRKAINSKIEELEKQIRSLKKRN